jgi:integrase
MGTIEKRKGSYRAKVYRGGSATFRRKAEASAWIIQREAELSGKALPYKTLSDALKRYANDVCPSHRGERWELLRLKALDKYDISRRKISKLTASDFATWRDDRQKLVSAATVLREINLLNSVLEVARRDWQWLNTNPLKDMRKPKAPLARRRRVSDDEIAKLVSASGWNGSTPHGLTQVAVVAFHFALETAMRSGEILGLTWASVKPNFVILEMTKNGERREVPLSPRAKELLAYMLCFDRPFPIAKGTRDALFRRLVVDAGLSDLHFHDSRAEAIYRLSKKMNALELAQCVGHKNLSSLQFYYRTTADELALRL